MTQPKRTPLALLLVGIFIFATACGGTPTPPGTTASAEPKTLQASNMAFDLADASGVQVHDYDFGDGSILTSNGKTVAYPRQGILAAPQSPGPHPLVVLFHGVKPGGLRNNAYRFGYLVRQLAAEGYVAVAFNVSVDYYSFDLGGESAQYAWGYYVYQEHIKLLQQANAGKQTGFGVDLQGKINFDEQHFLGHSRGGEMANEISLKEAAAGKQQIKSLILVESTIAPDKPPLTDTPVGIIIGEYDPEVPEDGQIVYDAAKASNNRTAPMQITFLRGANHMYFNEAFEEAPSLDENFPYDQTKALTRAQQQDFLTRYYCAFLSVYAKKSAPFGTFNSTEPQPSTLFGYAATCSLWVPGSQHLLTPSKAALGAITLGANTSDLAVEFLQKESQVQPPCINHPGAIANDRTLPLFSFSWQKQNTAATLPLQADLSRYSALSFYVAAYTSQTDFNPAEQSLPFSIRLTDTAGQAATVHVGKDVSAVAWHAGKLAQVYEYTMWFGWNPLGELRVPLSYFAGINLGKLAKAELLFDQTATGSLLLSDVAAVQ